MSDYRRVIRREFTADFEEFGPFYQALSDLGAIFWAFHAQRLKEGVYFAYDSEAEEAQPFNLERLLRNRPHGNDTKAIYDYIHGVEASIQLSLYQFLQEAGFDIPKVDLPIPPLTDGSRKFLGEPTQRLITSIQEQGLQLQKDGKLAQVGKIFDKGEQFSVLHELADGFHTGIAAAGQLIGIFGPEFKREYAEWMAKTQLKGFGNFVLKIGLGDFYSMDEIDYSLLHPTRGLDNNILQEHGLGKSRGCPAFGKVSDETRAYLRSLGAGDVVAYSLGRTFTERMQSEMTRSVLEPYQRLSPELQGRVTLTQRKMLDGRLLQQLRGKER